MRIRFLFTVLALTVFMLSVSSTTEAASISFSGNLTGVAFEDPAGRCSPLITVNAFGAGNSNLLGSYQDVQSHCTTSLTTFDNGVFTLTSVTSPGNSIFGAYSGTAAVQGAVLAFSASLLIQGGTGQFAAASGSLTSQGTLDQAGNYTASFAGVVETAPEPTSLSFGILGLLMVAISCFKSAKGIRLCNKVELGACTSQLH
ncbi:MAG: hypothetical protein JO185_17245 [Acidobacteriaceae bacterium]|nr:hypothetical protein [Acidobacteriaceae bacterium]